MSARALAGVCVGAAAALLPVALGLASRWRAPAPVIGAAGAAGDGHATDPAIVLGLAGLLLAAAVLAAAGTALRRLHRRCGELDLARQRWEQAAAADGLGRFQWRREADLIELDARAAQLFGLATSPQPGDAPQHARLDRRSCFGRVAVDDRPALARALASVRWPPAPHRPQVMQLRCRLRHPDGRLLHVEAAGLPRFDGRQRLVAVAGTLRDLTHVAEATQRHIEHEAAERTARARRLFLSRLSHELRTPLNAVLGFSQLMLSEPGEPLPLLAQARTRHIHAAGRQLLHLVDDLLEASRAELPRAATSAGPADPAAPTPDTAVGPSGLNSDLAAALQAAVQQIEPLRAECEVRIELDLPAGLPAVAAEPDPLRQVFAHLLSNGCKFNRRGGRLRVNHRCEDGVQNRPGEPGTLWLDFHDEGHGLAPHEIGELFQPFYRLPRHRQLPGSGLGLAVVRLLLDRMGGAIQVHGEPGRGSRFSVRLPARSVCGCGGASG